MVQLSILVSLLVLFLSFLVEGMKPPSTGSKRPSYDEWEHSASER